MLTNIFVYIYLNIKMNNTPSLNEINKTANMDLI